MIGTKVYGYCEGYFGRDDYEDKIVILEGRTWLVFAYTEREGVNHINFKSEQEKIEFINDNSTKESE